MPGLGRKATIQLKKPVFEEEEAKEKIKFDIFNNNEDEGGETTDYKKKTVLDNVSPSSLILFSYRMITRTNPL
jgi:hypothetical protein